MFQYLAVASFVVALGYSNSGCYPVNVCLDSTINNITSSQFVCEIGAKKLKTYNGLGCTGNVMNEEVYSSGNGSIINNTLMHNIINCSACTDYFILKDYYTFNSSLYNNCTEKNISVGYEDKIFPTGCNNIQVNESEYFECSANGFFTHYSHQSQNCVGAISANETVPSQECSYVHNGTGFTEEYVYFTSIEHCNEVVGNDTCEDRGLIKHLNWESIHNPIPITNSLPEYNFELEINRLDKFGINIELTLDYIGSSFLNNNSNNTVGTAYVFDFVQFRAGGINMYTDKIEEAGSCSNRLSTSYINKNFSSYWEYSPNPSYPNQLGSTDYLAYGPL
eukprot:126875_1